MGNKDSNGGPGGRSIASIIADAIRTRIDKNRRKRYSRPGTLVFFGILILCFPLINIASLAYYYGFDANSPFKMLDALNWFQMTLILFPLVVAYGLLRVRKWGWYAFLLYSNTLIVFNLVALIKNPAGYNAFALVQVVLMAWAIYYFLQKDISTPYMRLYPRGWRMDVRIPVEMDISIDSTIRRTRDLSTAGFYTDWPDAPFDLNDQVEVEFIGRPHIGRLNAGVVRIDRNGVGFAFRDLDKETRDKIEILIR